jgi:hypothetical protein
MNFANLTEDVMDLPESRLLSLDTDFNFGDDDLSDDELFYNEVMGLRRRQYLDLNDEEGE